MLSVRVAGVLRVLRAGLKACGDRAGLAGVAASLIGLIATGAAAFPTNQAETATSGDFTVLSGQSRADSTYLSLTQDRMRDQLAAGDLEPAARTLQWIRKIDPDDAVTGILAIELQLRRGNVAAAAMRLIEILDGPRVTAATQAEARRILALVKDRGADGAVLVTRAMLDAATLPESQGPLFLAVIDDAFAYEVVDLPEAGDAMADQILAFAATTPLGDMRDAAGSRTAP